MVPVGSTAVVYAAPQWQECVTGYVVGVDVPTGCGWSSPVPCPYKNVQMRLSEHVCRNELEELQTAIRVVGCVQGGNGWRVGVYAIPVRPNGIGYDCREALGYCVTVGEYIIVGIVFTYVSATYSFPVVTKWGWLTAW